MEKTDTTTRRLLLSIAASLLATLSGSAQLQDAPALFADAGNALVADAPDAAPIRSRSITARTGLLAAATPASEFAGAISRCRVRRRHRPARRRAPRAVCLAWARSPDVEDGEVTVSVTDGAAVGRDHHARLRRTGTPGMLATGSHVVEQVDTTRLLAEHGADLVRDPA